MSRIRIIYYSDAPCYGGAEYYLNVLATGLPRERFDVRVILRPLDTLDPLRRPLLESGVQVFEPPEPCFPNPAHWMSVYRYLRDSGADVFHLNLPGPYDGRMGSIAVLAKMAGVRVVTTEHLPMFKGPWRCQMAKRLSRSSVDLVITVSDTNVTCLERIHGIRGPGVHRVYNGVDLSVYNPNGDREGAREALGLTGEEKAVAIIGRLDPQKGHAMFLEAAERVSRAVPAARFLIIGEGGLKDDLQRAAGERGLASAVRFLGYRDDVPAILQAIDVVVFTSRQEGMPFALLEALAMERPVVATNVHGLSEIIRDGETGRLVEPGASEAAAEAIVELLEFPDKARALGKRGRERVVSEFDRNTMIRRTVDLYESLVD